MLSPPRTSLGAVARALLVAVTLSFSFAVVARQGQKAPWVGQAFRTPPTITMGTNTNLTTWLKAGGRGIDSAWNYGPVISYDWVREAMRARESLGIPRSEIFVTSKVPCFPSDYYFPFNLKPSNLKDIHQRATSVMDYMEIDSDRFWEVIEEFRSPHLWEKVGNEWQLRQPST